ncbi:MAG: bifunctional ornithine acetyltransferase/N-acetylglutamate synthase [Gammaproteobacteria bacterium]|nr:bifunctional ornithine acetyltransferase/N-acetylglutamate synthase [Gammaproteobacteria bacterium]
MIKQVEIDVLNIGIKQNTADAVCMKIPDGSTLAMVTTKNKFAAAPVVISKDNLQNNIIKYIFVNSGNANACTGIIGHNNAQQYARKLAAKLSCKSEEILIFSTGIIGKQLPMNNILSSLHNCNLVFKSTWEEASQAIMTTDKYNKYIHKKMTIQGQQITVNAICKGAGMIEPNMATMLAYLEINIKLSKSAINKLIKHVVDNSFNRISVDGDMSTNDSFVIIATADTETIDYDVDLTSFALLKKNITKICQDLSKMIIADGEGATKIIEIDVNNAQSENQAKKIAFAIANSNLVKTAMFGCDPNWGRILAKMGSVNVDLDITKITLLINNHMIFSRGEIDRRCNHDVLEQSMQNKEIFLNINLNSGRSRFKALCSDLSHEYVDTNSKYTT